MPATALQQAAGAIRGVVSITMQVPTGVVEGVPKSWLWNVH
jgi:hypothetical protein